MHVPLMDITDRIAEPPKWWLNGVPRYRDYHPEHARGQNTQLLVRVCCQNCQRVFDTAIGTTATLKVGEVEPVLGYPLDSATGTCIEARDDPPFHLGEDGHNCMGNSMGVEWVAILQVWERSGADWRRRFDLDGPSPESPI
jgi:hypothetical protein